MSPTQRPLSRSEVDEFIRASFDGRVAVVDASPLSGGGYAAVWRVTLDDGRTVVLKVAPPAEVPLMRYERDLIAAEARCYRLIAAHAPSVPVPVVLYQGPDWLVTTFLPGDQLSGVADGADQARADTGAAIATLHTITGSSYGYDGGRTGAATWPDAFAAIVADLLADAVDRGVDLPVAPDLPGRLVERHAGALSQVDRPALVYFDLWDGNVLVRPDADGTHRLCGIVDAERFLYGDPLMDLVSPAMHRRIEAEPGHPFLRGYGPVTFDEPARRRLGLYRMHLALLMLAEMPSRGMADRARYDRLAGHLRKTVDALD